MTARLDPVLVALRRRLEQWELEHLRAHCAELAEKVDELTRQLRDAEAAADMWQREAEAHREAWRDEGGTVALTVDGSVHPTGNPLE